MSKDPSETLADIFGPPIYTYTRKQALADGFQVDVSEMAREAGITFPVYLTRAVWDQHVKVPEGVSCQSETGRLWDILWMCRYGIFKAAPDAQSIEFHLHVRNTRRGLRLIKLKATIGAVDVDNPRPAITVSLPEED